MKDSKARSDIAELEFSVRRLKNWQTEINASLTRSGLGIYTFRAASFHELNSKLDMLIDYLNLEIVTEPERTVIRERVAEDVVREQVIEHES
jgi:hypothetical protein